MHKKDDDRLSDLLKAVGNSLIELGEFVKGYRRGAARLMDKDIHGTINELDLSVRAQNILESERIFSLDRLRTYTREELRYLRGCGEKVANEIADKMLALGVPMKDDSPVIEEATDA